MMMEEGYTTGFSGSAIIHSLQVHDLTTSLPWERSEAGSGANLFDLRDAGKCQMVAAIASDRCNLEAPAFDSSTGALFE